MQLCANPRNLNPCLMKVNLYGHSQIQLMLAVSYMHANLWKITRCTWIKLSWYCLIKWDIKMKEKNWIRHQKSHHRYRNQIQYTQSPKGRYDILFTSSISDLQGINVKLFLCMLWRALGLWEVEAPTFSDIRSQMVERLSALCASRFLPPGRFLVLT
jgi:hypothetical protein